MLNNSTTTVSLSNYPPNNTTTTTVEQYANASNSIVSGTASMTGLGDMTVVVAYSAILIMAAGYATSHYKRYARVRRVVEWLFGTFGYFLKGVATLATLAVAFAPIYLFTQTDSETQGWLLKALGVGIVGYFAVTVLGYIGDRFYCAVREKHERAEAEFGGPDESDDDRDADEQTDDQPDVALDGDGGQTDGE